MVSAFPLLVAAFGTSGVGPLEIVGTHPKTLGFSRFLGFGLASRQLRRSSEGAGASRRLFDGADTTGEIRFTSVRPRRKQKRRILFTFGMSCPRDHRKRQSERSPARSGIYRAKREATNIEKVGPTRFFNLFRTEFSFSRFVMTMVCKLL
jgi:hypothetical protein